MSLVEVRSRTAPPAKAAPTDISTLFLAAKPGTGSTSTVEGPFTSLDELTGVFGARVTGSAPMYDYLDAYWRESGGRAYVGAYASDFGDGLALFDKRLGPGQIAVIDSAPNGTMYTDLASAASDGNRVAIADVTLAADTLAEMETLGDALPATSERIGLFGPWVKIPGPSGIAGVGTRTVPASAVIAALCTRVDRDGNPNRAAAGFDYAFQYVSDVLFNADDTDRDTLVAHGVNPIAEVFGVLGAYGFQTPIEESTETPFWQLNAARARMWLIAQAQAIGAPFAFRNLDGQGKLQAQLASALSAPLKRLYDAGGLYGETAGDAYGVNVGVNVNTQATAAAAELHAVIQARFSLATKKVIIDEVSIPVSGSVL